MIPRSQHPAHRRVTLHGLPRASPLHPSPDLLPSGHILKRIWLPLRLFFKCIEKIDWVLEGDILVQDAEIKLNNHWHHKTLHGNHMNFYEKLFKQTN